MATRERNKNMKEDNEKKKRDPRDNLINQKAAVEHRMRQRVKKMSYRVQMEE